MVTTKNKQNNNKEQKKVTTERQRSNENKKQTESQRPPANEKDSNKRAQEIKKNSDKQKKRQELKEIKLKQAPAKKSLVEKIMDRKKRKLEKDGTPIKLIPTVSSNFNLNKRILSELYKKELSHAIFLVWIDNLYGDEEVNLDEIRAAITPLVRNASDTTLPAQNIFINGVLIGGQLKPAGSCFVMINHHNVGTNENLIWTKITKAKAHIIKVSLAMLRQHMKDERILILNVGYESILSQVPAKFIESINSVNNQECAAEFPQASSKSTSRTDQQNLKENLPKSVNKGTTGQSCAQQTQQQQTSKKKQVAQSVTKPTPDNVQAKRPSLNGIVHQDNPQTIGSVKEATFVKQDDYDSDIQIIDEPVQRQQVKVPVNPKDGKEFIPVTAETLPKAMGLMQSFVDQKRVVAIVFDSCFLLEEINMKLIREKFKSIFGSIEKSQVLIRLNVPKLAKDLDEANKLNFTRVNQAYIIGDLGLTDNEINTKSAARGIFCCPMTLGCVINNLKQGLYLMHRDTLEGGEQQNLPSLRLAQSNGQSNNVTSELNTSKDSNNSLRSIGNSTGKRTRIAASFGGVLASTNSNEVKPSLSISRDSQNLTIVVNGSGAGSNSSVQVRESKQNQIDETLYNSLISHGNSILRIDNLPSKLTVQALNLMMGSFTLKSEQIIAAVKENNLMDLRVVTMRNNEDVPRILGKNGCKTCHNTRLNIELSNHAELREFIGVNVNNIKRLNSNIGLPVNRIGYSSTSA